MSGEAGKVLKVLTVDSEGQKTGEWSQQLPADPFQNGYEFAGLQEPPFSLEQLIFLAEQHPTHAAVLEQKAADVVGTGWRWEAVKSDETEQGDDAEKDRLDEWFDGLASSPKHDETTHEIVLSAWNDLETVGQGMIELSRDPKGELRHWFRLPAHTCRFHRDGVRVAQVRQGRKVWFKRWIPGDEREVDRVTGAVTEGRGSAQNRANEVFVLKRPSRRSTWYGVPTYIPATGWITLSTAARDDNLWFFENRREPRWAVILENVDEDPKLEQQLTRALSVDMKKPHRNLVIPLAGPAKVNFQQLGDNKGDMSWEKLQERADAAVLIAHRMPGERIGLVRVGALGGSVVSDTTRVYKESFVQTSQAILASRINRLIEAESGVENPKWKWAPEELDLTEEGAVQEQAVKGFQGGVLMLDEAREELGRDPLEEKDERGKKFFFELAPAAAAGMARAKATEDAAAIHVDGQALTGDQLNKSQAELADHIRSLLDEGAPGAGGA